MSATVRTQCRIMFFLNITIQCKEFCPPVKTSCPSAETIDATPGFTIIINTDNQEKSEQNVDPQTKLHAIPNIYLEFFIVDFKPG